MTTPAAIRRKIWRARLIAMCMPAMAAVVGHAFAQSVLATPVPFSFGVIEHMHADASDDSQLRNAILASDADNLAFVVASGIKAATEPCSDELYIARKEIFQSAKNGLIVSLAASDWSSCQGSDGHSLAIERLNRVRDLFFEGDFSFGSAKVPMVRQANTRKYRAYRENLRWGIGSTIFATVNLPANNNDFVAAAGRNGEFEDRVIADRDWLQRVFSIAAQKNAAAIVLFCDADPMNRPDMPEHVALSGSRDGFAEIRGQLQALSTRFSGRILLVHGDTGLPQPVNPEIKWHANLGSLRVAPGWLKITVDPAVPTGFRLSSMQPLRTAGN
ncbi:MAG: hypothetical protein NVSMB6_22230 [Burkholderiaceae bacterium]